jgi:hypothetical protein
MRCAIGIARLLLLGFGSGGLRKRAASLFESLYSGLRAMILNGGKVNSAENGCP